MERGRYQDSIMCILSRVCFLVHCSIDCANLTDELIKTSMQFMKANTGQSILPNIP